MIKLRKGSRVWTPRANAAIEHSNGRRYLVDGNGSTIRNMITMAEDRKLMIKKELRRLSANFKDIEVLCTNKEAEEFKVRIGNCIPFVNADDLWNALRQLPAHAGRERAIQAGRKLARPASTK